MTRPWKRSGSFWVRLAATLPVAGLILVLAWWVSAPRAVALNSPGLLADVSARQVTRSPADAAAWLQVATAESALRGGCDQRCADALGHSFDAAPLDVSLFPWRTRFALENWSDLPPPLRVRVQRHVEAAWTVRPGRRDIQGLTRVVASPAGRLTITLLAADLDAREKAAPATESLP